MYLTLTGLNHRQTGIALREKFSVPPAELPEALRALNDDLRSEECLLLSTCNRVEVYLVHRDRDPDVAGFLARWKKTPAADLARHLYRFEGGEAARHLFRVASSLDSMIVGENQILHQVKDAYQAAAAEGRTGKILNQLFQQALHVGKRIRSETGIGEGGISVPSLAAKLAGKVFSDLGSKTLLLLGAGETGSLALEAFRDRGITRIVVANRTPDRARRISPDVHPLEQFPGILPDADIVVACLADREYLVTPEMVRNALGKRRREPMFFLDLGVPRNIHPGIKKLEDAYLFNIDDLEMMAEQNIRERRKEIDACRPIIGEEVDLFLRGWASLDLHGVIARLHEAFHEIGDEELKKSLERLRGLDPEAREEIRELLRRTINKLLYAPSTALRRETQGAPLVDLAIRLFALPNSPPPEPGETAQKPTKHLRIK